MRGDSNSSDRRLSRRTLLGTSVAAGVGGMAGCLGSWRNSSNPSNNSNSTDEFVFAATARDDPADVARDFEPLAAWLDAETGVPTRINALQSPSAAIGALASGHAHVAYLSGGPAWVGWQQHGLEVLVVEADAAGQTHYVAGAWVRDESDIDTVADLEGVDSCHTGDLTGAGMLIPTAHLAHEGHVSFDSDDDVTAIRRAVDEFFGDPLIGGGYVGALQCLSQGHGDVAFVRKSTPEDYCGGADRESWCLDLEEYRLLAEFAEVPSHPIMAGPAVSEDERALLTDAFLALNGDPEGEAILADVLAVDQLVKQTAAEHLGPYGELIEILPGIEDHLVT